MRVSVVVPTLNEAENLAPTLASLPKTAEVIVSDGESHDGTATLASRLGAKVISGAKGRARQMNRGAEKAASDVLLFLHADCRLSADALPAMERALSDPAVVAGSFRLAVHEGRLLHKLVAWGSNARARYLKTPYGDQGLFVRRDVFERVGGFPDVPIMEDVAMVRKLRPEGRLVALDVAITTGKRHWQGLGVVGATLVNWLVSLLYLVGVPPAQIEPIYRKLRNGEPRGSALGPVM